MAGVPGRSGGQNRLSVEEHERRGTLRPARHLKPVPPPAAPVGAADRRRTLRGLSPTARRIASQLLAAFDGWDVSTLETLRAYALSCDRLEAMQTATTAPGTALYRELRINLQLQRALNLEQER